MRAIPLTSRPTVLQENSTFRRFAKHPANELLAEKIRNVSRKGGGDRRVSNTVSTRAMVNVRIISSVMRAAT